MTPTAEPWADFGLELDANYPHRLDLSFDYADERRARLIHDAVAVEVGQIDDERSMARVKRQQKTLHVGVFARDLVALRAGTNTWIRLVETAEDILTVAAER